MYLPRAFREDDLETLHAFIERHSFGTLMVAPPGAELAIAHVPMVLDRAAGSHGRLRLHVATANPIWRLALAAGKATVVFNGPHAYVSARWYETPTLQVPTWNYAVVQAEGTPARLGEPELLALLDDLVAVHEGDRADAWSTKLLAPELRDGLLREIVGLAFDITKLQGKSKLSQNRSEVDHARVVEGLRERGSPDDLALVALMTRPRP